MPPNTLLKIMAAAVSLAFGAYPANAQEDIQSIVNGITLDRLDEIIRDADARIAALKAGSALALGPNDAEQSDGIAPQGGKLPRSRFELLCFADGSRGQTSRRQLDAFLADAQGALSIGTRYLQTFDDFRGDFAEGSCNPFMVQATDAAAVELQKVSRGEMVELILHLETCYPDEGITEADGSELDMDARFYNARGLLQNLRRLERSIREAQEYCG